jgi:hypothetical protein
VRDTVRLENLVLQQKNYLFYWSIWGEDKTVCEEGKVAKKMCNIDINCLLNMDIY